MRREVKIGIFAVLMIGALWAGIRFLKGFDIFSRNAVYYAAYDQVDGVQNASPILIRGVKVGAVTDISFDPSIGNEVVLQLTIQRKYRIPSNSEARIYSNSIMGAKAIEIALGDAGTYLQSGDTLCSSRSKGLMDMAGSELEFFKQKMSQVVGDLSRTMDNLNLIMEQNAANIEGTMSHLNSITGSVNGMLLSQRANLESAVANLTRFSEMLGENSPRMDSIILNLSNFTDQIQRENLAGALDSTLMNLNAILARVNAGRGLSGSSSAIPVCTNRSTRRLRTWRRCWPTCRPILLVTSISRCSAAIPKRPTASSRKRGETCPARFAQGPESGPIVSNVFSVR